MSYDHDVPEGLLGAILTMDGINDAVTVINGPTGCKYYPSSASESAFPYRDDVPKTYNPFKYYREFFFSQPRVPCTYLDSNDYIMGSAGRLDRLVDDIVEMDPKLICIINSPGASLIGEDLRLQKDPDVPVVRMESPEPSVPMGKGSQDAMVRILDSVDIRKKEGKGINLIGISVWHLGWMDTIKDLTYLLRLCDVSVNAVVGAGCSVEELKCSGSSELNAIVYDDFGVGVGEWYADNLDIPFFRSEFGIPLGFDALEHWISSICRAVGADSGNAMTAIRDKRKRAAHILSELNSERRPPRGRTFSVSANGPISYTVTEFLYSYLGMVPVAVNTGMDRSWDDRIEGFLSKNHLIVSNDVFNTPADIMIGDGNNISSAMHRNVISGGYAMIRPGLQNINVIERPVLGLGGTVRLLDSVLNILERSL